MAGLIGEVPGAPQQSLPIGARQPAAFEISPCPLAPMIEEADVVVRVFERADFRLDEGI